MSKYDVKIEDNKLKLGLDTDEDGVKSLMADVMLDEAIQEALKKGEAVEGEQMVKFSISQLGEFKLLIDTDKDGEISGEITLNIMEALNEAGVL